MRYLSPILMVPFLFLLGCGGEEHQDIKQWMTAEAKDLRGRVLPLPEIKPFPIVSYDSNDLIDPFSPAKVIPEKRLGGGGLVPNFDRPKEPLEAHPLESLKMVGVVRKAGVMHALIQAGDNMIHQIKAGNHVGQNFGLVTAVTEADVRVTELVQDPSGQSADWIERQASLQLLERAEPEPKKQEGKK